MSGAALDAILDGRLHIDDVTDAMDAVVTDFHLMSFTKIVSDSAIAFGRIFIMNLLYHIGDLKIYDFTVTFPTGCPIIVSCT